MARDALNDLAAFVAIADDRSFTRAAARLGLSPSALSHAMRALEERLGVRLLTRTTRSVAITEAGERLLTIIRPALATIETGIDTVRSSRGKPVGTVRITAVKHAVTSVLAPMLPGFMARYPDIRLEIDVDDGFSDIVASGYDAGIRFEGSVDKDMIALRIGPEIGVAVVASPGYLAGRATPAAPGDLAGHRCIVHRRPDGTGTYSWPFQDDGRIVQLRVIGPLAFNDSDLVLAAAVAGQGIACVFADLAAPHVERAELVQVLEAWSPKLPGYTIYYPSRRQNPPALATLLASLKARATLIGASAHGAA